MKAYITTFIIFFQKFNFVQYNKDHKKKLKFF